VEMRDACVGHLSLVSLADRCGSGAP
jgi:hypothetical protein